MNDVENELRSRVDAFVNELSELIRRQALEAVEEVLKKGEISSAPRRVGRPPKSLLSGGDEEGTRKAVGRPRGRPAKVPTAAAKRRAGEKRTPQQLAQITDQVFGYIKTNGGQGVEQIAKALSTSTKELTLPIRKLLAEKKIGSKGQKRATRYFPR